MQELTDRFNELEKEVAEYNVSPELFRLVAEMCAISALLDIQEAMCDG